MMKALWNHQRLPFAALGDGSSCPVNDYQLWGVFMVLFSNQNWLKVKHYRKHLHFIRKKLKLPGKKSPWINRLREKTDGHSKKKAHSWQAKKHVTERTKAVLAMDPLTPFTNFVDAFDHWAKVGRDTAVGAVFGCVLKGGFRENGENGDYASKLVAYFHIFWLLSSTYIPFFLQWPRTLFHPYCWTSLGFL